MLSFFASFSVLALGAGVDVAIAVAVDVIAVGIRRHRGTTSSILLVSSDLVLGDGAHPMLRRVVQVEIVTSCY